MWKTVLAPPAICATAAGAIPCVAVALAEMPESATCLAGASPSLRRATATSIASPRCASEGDAVTEATVRLAGFCTVAVPAFAAGGARVFPALASVPEAEAESESEPLPETEYVQTNDCAAPPARVVPAAAGGLEATDAPAVPVTVIAGAGSALSTTPASPGFFACKVR